MNGAWCMCLESGSVIGVPLEPSGLSDGPYNRVQVVYNSQNPVYFHDIGLESAKSEFWGVPIFGLYPPTSGSSISELRPS